MSPRMFNQHAYDVKLKIFIKNLIKSNQYQYNNLDLDVLRRDQTPLVYVFDVLDKLKERIGVLVEKRKIYYKKLEDATDIDPEEDLLRNCNPGTIYSGLFRLPDITRWNCKTEELAIQFIQIDHKLKLAKQYKHAINDIISTKPYPIVSKPQESCCDIKPNH